MSNRYVGGVVTETTNVAQSPWSGSWTEQAAMQGFGSVLRIPNSLRFRSSASAYLNRTQASGSQTTWTWSGWVKRGAINTGSTQYLLQAGGSFGAGINFLSADTLQFEFGNGSSQPYIRTSAVFRDPSAWYHIVAVADTTNATAANRLTLYVNGVLQVLGVTDYPAQNYAGYVNQSGVVAVHGRWNGGSPNQYFDGYMAEINFVDGQALPPTAFGAINKETGVWAPITYTGTYGLNGFRLNFFNGTSTTTLGYDSSGNGNNWTTNNISLTAGSTYDWMIDSPSKIQGTSYGVGNYCVMNAASVGADCTLSDGNLGVAYGSSGTRNATMATIGMPSGKWYAEFSYTGGSTPDPVVGISSKASSTDMPNYPGYNAYGWGYYNDGTKYNNGSSSAYGATWTTNDVIGIAFDADAGSLTFYKNGASQGVAFTGLTSGPYYFAIGDGAATSTFTGWFNFGQRPFAYTPPSGYKTLCTQNLPVATIYNGAQYMAATLYTGSGASPRQVSNVGFAPDLVWIKSRSAGYDALIFDTVRSAGKSLTPSSTSSEVTNNGNGYLSAFGTDGFTLTQGSSSIISVNENGTTYVGWQWKAGGTAVTNTAGTITSSVSANTTAGFSVVTYTGNGTNGATVGHGLGVAPVMMIMKSRSLGPSAWSVYHTSTGIGYELLLNSTAAAAAASNDWNNTLPTSSVFTLGTAGSTNTSGATFVAYCFATIPGYSAFGSYTGNGSSDGAFVFLGFRPRFMMIKRTDTTSNWVIVDSARNVYNPQDLNLYPNLSAAEDDYTSTYPFDMLSNGVKFRANYGNVNASGGTYIYAAFAENPFSVALAR